jgi:hypothetical protein
VKSFDPGEWPKFIQTPAFERECSRLGLNQADLQAMEAAILTDPTRAPVMQGTGGVRKIRFSRPGSGKGKSGAYRACYGYFPEFGAVVMLTIFGKNEKANLSSRNKKDLSELMVIYRQELERHTNPNP